MDAGTFEWRGGHPSLDFVNTRSWGKGPAEERLVSYDAFLDWANEARLPVAAAELRRRARRRPGEAERALARVRDLRSLVRRVLAGVAARRPEPRALASFNLALRRAMATLELEPRAFGIGCEFLWRGQGLEQPLYVLIWRTAELLSSDELGRLGACANPGCGWLFLDQSRRGNRRWCDMQVCGSRAKARRYYYRRRAAAKRSAGSV
jgi:predicted RNA-binding Zn ribbon-like protein